MANDYPFAPPGHAGKGHPAYDNRNRGYNKGRGSYNGGRGGRSQNSGNYGPRAVPVPIQVPNPMAPWAQKYGRYTPGQSPQFFMPLASAPWMSPASPYSTYSGMQPRAFSTSSAPHVGTLAHTPIATPHITIPKAAIMSSGPSTKGNGNLGNSRTNGSGSGAKNAEECEEREDRDDRDDRGTGEGASDALHIHAPIPKRIHKLTPKHHHLPGGTPTAHSVLRDFIPYEGQNSVMDAAHNTPDATVKLLDHDSLMQLQVFNITLAHKLQRKLEEAKMARRDGRNIARDSERNHVKTVQRLEERFYSKMQEACKLSGEAKKNGMIAATTQLKAGPDFSRLALRSDRNELNDLDNARAISRNKYSDTIHEVLMQALGGKAVGQADQVDAAQKKTSVVSMAPAQDDRKDSAQIAQLAKDQPVFERQPETEHQSINEVLHRTTVTDAPHESDKTGYVIPPKSRFVDSSTSFKQSTNDTELEAFPDFWVPEKIRGLAPVGDGAMLTAQVEARKDDVAKKQEAKNGDAVKKQDTSKDKAPNTKTENKTPAPSAVPKTQGNDKSKAPVVSKQQPNQSGNQGTGKVRKKNFRKKGGNGGAGGDGKDKGGGGVGGSGMANAAPKTGQAAGDGKDKGAGGKANAIPKTGPAAGDMRKGG
ncbi:hypothetical protein SNOG_03816 [Parastagonospora nodorum SN15]|uniref:Uncharacterized protein n=1 Tax=Phaeosphaeria nodorum (strain SN15 / ATCC MYA-4574 / FGSC 10173) TaxID=321614 RepID=Q0UWP8_PHANO|nr:hypothetical protein SNOG_03816 [Parastagonospora nodorum SN15]EAT89021.2 hypothetical protein SNOG_03816 [Parastagonospora nodorum SN15]